MRTQVRVRARHACGARRARGVRGGHASAGGALPGARRRRRQGLRQGRPNPRQPSRRGPTVEDFTLHSAAHRSLSEILVLPAGARADGSALADAPATGAARRPLAGYNPGSSRACAMPARRAPDVLLVTAATTPTTTTALTDRGRLRDPRGDPRRATTLRRRPTPAARSGDLDGRFRRVRHRAPEPGRFCAIGGHSARCGRTWPDSVPARSTTPATSRATTVIAAARAPPPLRKRRIWLDGGLRRTVSQRRRGPSPLRWA